MKTYQDHITKKTVAYNEDDFFIIKTRAGHNKKLVKRVFSSDRIEEAFSEFYALPIAKNYHKYLFLVSKDAPDSEKSLVLRMKGELSKVAVENLHLKNRRFKGNMKTAPIGSLTRCPLSLVLALDNQDFSNYPTSIFKWTNQKLIYALLAYAFSLSPEEKNKILSIGDKELFKHKELSGFPIEQLNTIKVDVSSKDELL